RVASVLRMFAHAACPNRRRTCPCTWQSTPSEHGEAREWHLGRSIRRMVCQVQSPFARVCTRLPYPSCQELSDILDRQEVQLGQYYRGVLGTIDLSLQPENRRTVQIHHRLLASVPLDRSRYSPKLEPRGICRTEL